MDENSRATDRPWAATAEETLRGLGVARDSGLSETEAAHRLETHGPNQLREAGTRSAVRILLDQLRSMVIVLLVAAACASLIFVGIEEALAILVVIALNTLIGFATELRAVKAMSALRALGTRHTNVRRSGRVRSVRSQDLVPGDIVVLEGGDVVTADLRLVQASRLRADESTFTGESLPVHKTTEPLQDAERVDERQNMLFKGTSLTRGSAEAVVVATGMQTELGRISKLTETAESDLTPLERKLDRLANRLIFATIAVAAVVVAAGVAAGKSTLLMIETGIALAVATIPEGLPIVATIALARGLWRMSRRNALINHLAAVETLGATSVICTDKTGTLTENRMRVARVVVGDAELTPEDGTDPRLQHVLAIGVLCNHASLGDTAEESVGDPLEVALLLAGTQCGLHRQSVLQEQPEIGVIAFDSETKRMATLHRTTDGVHVAVKGAPEAVLGLCTSVRTRTATVPLDDAQRAEWTERGRALAATGLRMIAVAEKTTPDSETEAYERLTLVGLIAFVDPPRHDVQQAITACHEAGIRVFMLTGDHPATASYIASAVGLTDSTSPPAVAGDQLEPIRQMTAAERRELREATIFARVSPEQKLDLIALHQEAGDVVGMVGDGVNDAPALKLADIGIAMGRRGTQVAREAADMVLTDDAFPSIVAAVEEGRAIFRNIRKFVFYLLSCNVSEVLILATASAMNTPLPILPLQILFLNLVSDVFPALALGMGEATANTLRTPPRDPKDGILTRQHALAIGGYGVAFTFATLTLFFLALGPLDLTDGKAATLAFLTLAFAQLWHVFNMREASSPVLRNEVTSNRHVWAALLTCTGMLLVAVYVPFLANVLELEAPTSFEWLLVLAFSLTPLAAGQLALRLTSVDRPK